MSGTTNPQTASALTIYRPLVEKTVAALGALVTHQIAYLVVSLIGLRVTAISDHGHLSTQWAIVAPLAVGAIAWFIVRQLNGLGFRSSISARYLSVLVVGFFLIQEFAEGLVGGQSLAQIAAHPAILAGVLTGPIVAWVLCRLLARVTELAARFLTERDFDPPLVQPKLLAIPVRCTPSGRGTPSRPRAPPSRLRI